MHDVNAAPDVPVFVTLPAKLFAWRRDAAGVLRHSTISVPPRAAVALLKTARNGTALVGRSVIEASRRLDVKTKRAFSPLVREFAIRIMCGRLLKQGAQLTPSERQSAEQINALSADQYTAVRRALPRVSAAPKKFPKRRF